MGHFHLHYCLVVGWASDKNYEALLLKLALFIVFMVRIKVSAYGYNEYTGELVESTKRLNNPYNHSNGHSISIYALQTGMW